MPASGQEQLSLSAYGIPFASRPKFSGPSIDPSSGEAEGYRTQLRAYLDAQARAFTSAAAHNWPYELSRHNMAAEWQATAALQRSQQ